MPEINPLLLELNDLNKGAITRGEIEIVDSFEWSELTETTWETFTGLELNIDIPDNARALLLTNYLTLRTYFNGGYTHSFYSRMNIDNGRWISPTATITVENLSYHWGSYEINVSETGTNMFLMKNSHADWKTGSITINVELQADYNMSEHDMTSDGILSAAILLR